jgi:hypothetical protein
VIKTFTGHRAGRWGCGVVVVDGRRRQSASDGETGEREQEEEDGREGKRRKVSPNPETTDTPATAEPIPNPPSNQPADHLPNASPTNPQIPHALSAPSHTPQTTTPVESDTAYIVTGTDTPSAILYDLQSRTILQRLNPRTYSNPSSQSDPTAEPVAPEVAVQETGAAAQAAHEKEAAAAGDEDEACLAVGAHPFRRELAIGGLGDGGVVRVWRDFS